MTRSLMQQDDDWDEFNSTTKTTTNPFNHYNAIFSDDEDDHHQGGSFSRWFTNSNNNNETNYYVDPVLSSSTYHIHQADNALLTLKHVVAEKEGWKKALKHKSGVIVHMKNGLHKGDKTPIFKGEAIIQGFSPQSIFYVVGMRKLWDEQYEDGNLVENLNDTTSLTYEVMKPTATSKSRDLSLVEKIECTQNGAIVFACTSVESPKIPRISGKTRVNIKLQGWILEPLHGGPLPATRVTFVIQESMKGWVPGFAKKSLARRPLVISKVAEYLEKKTERMKQQQQQQKKLQSNSFLSIHHGSSRRPSVMQPTTNSLNKNNTHQQSILIHPEPPKKHISFADNTSHDKPVVRKPNNTSKPAVTVAPPPPTRKAGHLYPTHRHPIQKVESIQLLKKLSSPSSYDHWSLTKELEDGVTKYYQYTNALFSSDEEDNPFHLQHRIKKKDEESKRKTPFIRVDTVIHGWSPEQLCSAIQCFGSRKQWDTSFEEGHMIDRFSQKEYLVQWFLNGPMMADIDLSAITSIETDPITGTVYTATTSVTDAHIPPTEHRIRAHTDLYGWVFHHMKKRSAVQVTFIANMDFKYVVPDATLPSWVDTCFLQSIQRLDAYLTTHGCPPYIRRVAGKVVQETYEEDVYKMVYVAKHAPSKSYRARKQQATLWCTDIRFYHETVDIVVQPEEKVNVEVSFQKKSIKVFTMDEEMDGQQVTVIVKKKALNVMDKEQFVSAADVDVSSTSTTTIDETSIEEPSRAIIEPETVKMKEIPANKENAKIPATKETVEVKEIPANKETVEAKKEEVSTPPDREEEKKEVLKVPEGYLLVPEHHHYQHSTANILMITDELSFNSQQLSVIFIAMVICYYMGKFTSSCHC